MSDNSKIPELTIDGSAIEGWKEVNRWAAHNHLIWHSTHKIAEQQNLTETQTLRLLAYQLLKQNVGLFDNLNEAMKCQARVIVVKEGALP